MSETTAGVHLVDGGALGCARLLLLLRAHAARLPAGAVIHLSTTNGVAPVDIPVWCRITGHTWLGPVPGTSTPTYAVAVGADPVPTQADSPWKVARQPSEAPVTGQVGSGGQGRHGRTVDAADPSP